MKKIILPLLLFALVSIVSWSQNLTVTMTTAGTLSTLLPDDLSSYDGLTIKGDINGTDLLAIYAIDSDTALHIATLDLSAANIVAGGDAYFRYMGIEYYTVDNEVSQYMFKARKFRKLVLPNSVTKIGYSGMSGFRGVEVILGNGLKAIDDYGLSDMSQVTAITVPERVDSMGRCALGYNKNLEKVVLPIQLKELADGIFQFDTKLTQVVIPAAVERLGASAFFDCESLEDITVPASVKVIGHNAFASCYKLASIDVDPANRYYSTIDGVLYNKDATQLVRYAIAKPETEFAIPNSVTSIAGDAFWESALEKITMGDNVTELDSLGYTFYACKQLKEIRLSDAITYLPTHVLASCEQLATVVLPKRLAHLGESAFMSSGLKGIVIPEGVDTIPIHCFQTCNSLEEVTLPSTMKYLDGNAFGYDYALRNITVKAVTPPECEWEEYEVWDDDDPNYGEEGTGHMVGYSTSFNDVDTLAVTLKVPAGSLEAYKQHRVWKAFVNTVALGNETGVIGVQAVDPDVEIARYSVDGVRLDAPAQGLNIIRYRSGKTRKVWVK